MRKAIVYDADDIKAILAKQHDVAAKDVIRNQYSYTVILGDQEASESSEDIGGEDK